MQQADRFVPICDVEKQSFHSVHLESPPPYRQNLQIDVGTLTGLLGMVGAEEDQLRLRFERRQNVVRAAPLRPGRLAATTKETPFKEETDQSPKRVAYDPHRQELTLTVSYPDCEIKTPTATAKNLSRRLTGALSMVPTEKYLTNFMKDFSENPPSGRAAEAALHTTRMVATALSAPIIYGILDVVTHAPRPWETLVILAAANLFHTVLYLHSAFELMSDKLLDEKEMPFARAIAENPSRALYPASLVHECLLPTARYLTRQAATPTQLLRAG